MIDYEVCPIGENHFLKILKCSSSSSSSSPAKQNQEKEQGFKKRRKPLIVIIPGNPGVIEFYEAFAIELNKLTDCDILGISHTGHFYDNKIKRWKCQPVSGGGGGGGVLDQVNDKVKFLENYLMRTKNDVHNNGEPAEIFLIGHSFGCYTILEVLALLSTDLHQRVKHSFLLFPMVERMKETPNGKGLLFLVKYFLWFIYFVAFVATTFLPQFIQKFLISIAFLKRFSKADYIHDNLGEVILKMASSFPAIQNSFHLGRNELEIVSNLNTHSVSQNFEHLTFYYGTQDQWAPIEYYYDMKFYIADLFEKKYVNEIEEMKEKGRERVILDECQPQLDHAFCIFKRQTSAMSNMIADWILKLN